MDVNTVLLNNFVKKVKDMRDAQANYFAARKKQDQEQSNLWFYKTKACERDVDKFIESYERDKAQPQLGL
jgi:hypothetical protein